ncbi:metallophosphoesterase family protein [Haladaptatus sp. ZSTT2]|uniref:metallophosphoesterase family protein n=1 Tax=Haladaptatus sp. ZSTT2 TaxID=3120515 RepID=UPI00300F49BC
MTSRELPQQSSRQPSAHTHDDAGPLFARFARPRTDTQTTLAIISDVHLSTRESGSWKVYHRTEQRLQTAISDINAREVDGVVFTGDLTENGEQGDFERVAALFADIDAPAVAVPGNHDVPKDFDQHDVATLDWFAETFTPGGLPFRTRIGGVDVIGLDSATGPNESLSATHKGQISAAQIAWLDEVLDEAICPLVVMHHNLPGMLELTGGVSWRSSFPMLDYDPLVEVLEAHDVSLTLSGHLHIPAVAQTERINELICPALSSYPQGYLLLTVDELGTTVRYVPVADGAGAAEAYMLAQDYSDRSKAVAELTQFHLESLPLHDEFV